jgi:hypothetical protein
VGLVNDHQSRGLSSQELFVLVDVLVIEEVDRAQNASLRNDVEIYVVADLHPALPNR